MRFSSIFKLRKWVGLFLSNSIIKEKLSDKMYLKLAFYAKMGKRLRLKTPETYNEKLQWLKLYDRKPEYTKLVDKYEVKEFLSRTIGEQYVIPSLGVWDNFENVDFAKLPDQFVLKCTHDSGGVVICKDKNSFDIEAARAKINKSLGKNYYYSGREWPYKAIKPRIIAEVYLEDEKYGELRDYKFFSFHGVPKLMFVASERQSKEETKFDFFDMEYNFIDMRNGHPNAKVHPEKPMHFELMKILTEKLSKGIPHVRVDFYEVNGSVYVGELTLYHWSGLTSFDPPEWDKKMGEWISLKVSV